MNRPPKVVVRTEAYEIGSGLYRGELHIRSTSRTPPYVDIYQTFPYTASATLPPEPPSLKSIKSSHEKKFLEVVLAEILEPSEWSNFFSSLKSVSGLPPQGRFYGTLREGYRREGTGNLLYGAKTLYVEPEKWLPTDWLESARKGKLSTSQGREKHTLSGGYFPDEDAFGSGPLARRILENIR